MDLPIWMTSSPVSLYCQHYHHTSIIIIIIIIIIIVPNWAVPTSCLQTIQTTFSIWLCCGLTSPQHNHMLNVVWIVSFMYYSKHCNDWQLTNLLKALMRSHRHQTSGTEVEEDEYQDHHQSTPNHHSIHHHYVPVHGFSEAKTFTIMYLIMRLNYQQLIQLLLTPLATGPGTDFVKVGSSDPQRLNGRRMFQSYGRLTAKDRSSNDGTSSFIISDTDIRLGRQWQVQWQLSAK